MEILKPTANSHFFCRPSLFLIHRIKNPSNFHSRNFNFPLYPQFPLKFSICTGKNFRVAAHFGRRTKRRNSLRKKITEQQHQVRQNPTIYHQSPLLENPVLEFDDSSNNFPLKKSDNDMVKVESVLWNQLGSWVDQYKADSEFWGIGSSPIFTVFKNSDGGVEKVVVSEDEILRRSQIEPSLYKQKELGDLKEVNVKLSHAKYLAREMETGNNVLRSNSSVAKFVNSGNQLAFVNTIRGGVFSKISRIGIAVLCVVFVFFALKRLFTAEEDKEEEYSQLEKEMLRRKIRARMEKEKLVKGSVEVIQKDSKEPEIVPTERPRLDKQELLNSIATVKVSDDTMASPVLSDTQSSNSTDFDCKIREIREMARHAREIEKKDHLPDANSEVEDNQIVNGFSNEKKNIEQVSLGNLRAADGVSMEEKRIKEGTNISKLEVPNFTESITRAMEDGEYSSNLSNTEEVKQMSKTPYAQSKKPEKHTEREKPRIIISVKEAREYLSQKHDKQEQHQGTKVGTVQQVDSNENVTSKREFSNKTSPQLGENGKVAGFSVLSRKSDFQYTTYASADNTPKRNESVEDSTLEKESTVPTKKDSSVNGKGGNGISDHQVPMHSLNHASSDAIAGESQSVNQESWLEKNFHEFEPIVEKIGVGFRDNYMVAREKVNKDINLVTEKSKFQPDEDGSELDWMKDDKLREIVFQVRENELMGRDPFYLMDAEDKLLFFEGLEKKVDKENEKLVNVHQWVHSNVENLDYGADGISLYDPLEKIIPRWKGPPPETSPEFLNDYAEQRKALFSESLRNSNLVKSDQQDSFQKPKESSSHDNAAAASLASAGNDKLHIGDKKGPRIIIEGSDGSVRAGKKSGKEYWQHTKKWSRGFLESYNAEADPEIKAVMKDIGKDLDRWITEKEIQDAADLMNKIPEKGQKFIQEKLNKVKREMEMFGPQAVMSKYSEFAEEEEEDYLWWLDLPFVLCIELYINEDGNQRIGFYSLEMAGDLELEPKPCHVIAFEDAGDCKNLCYIIQAHMEMLGNGSAFAVARPPKDALREAKANGFNVTVIRKGQLQLNVDQTLEEVEEQITEIGSKMYHDQITRGRSVDIGSLMKGVFGFKKPTRRRRSRRNLKKP